MARGFELMETTYPPPDLSPMTYPPSSSDSKSNKTRALGDKWIGGIGGSEYIQKIGYCIEPFSIELPFALCSFAHTNHYSLSPIPHIPLSPSIYSIREKQNSSGGQMGIENK